MASTESGLDSGPHATHHALRGSFWGSSTPLLRGIKPRYKYSYPQRVDQCACAESQAGRFSFKGSAFPNSVRGVLGVKNRSLLTRVGGGGVTGEPPSHRDLVVPERVLRLEANRLSSHIPCSNWTCTCMSLSIGAGRSSGLPRRHLPRQWT